MNRPQPHGPIRLRGHELYSEGAAFGPPSLDARGGRTYWGRTNPLGGTGGVGRGVCSCGSASPVLDSGTKRKQWHREHKAEIRREQAAGTGG